MSAPPASLYHVKCGTREMRLNQVQNYPIHLLYLYITCKGQTHERQVTGAYVLRQVRRTASLVLPTVVLVVRRRGRAGQPGGYWTKQWNAQ